MAKVVWTDEARVWLREIFEYIADEHPETAQRVIERILAKAESLASFPEIGPALEIQGYAGLRVLHIDSYRIVYRCAATERVEIIGVFHDALDLVRHLGTGRDPDQINE